jgi:hypothetical protein
LESEVLFGVLKGKHLLGNLIISNRIILKWSLKMSPIQWVLEPFSPDKRRLYSEADYPQPSSVEFQDVWSYGSRLISLHRKTSA